MRRYHLHTHQILSHLDTITIKGLTASDKRDIEKLLNQKNADAESSGPWDYIKYTIFVLIGLSLLICLIYSIYQWYKNRNVQFQKSPALGAYGGYGGYQQNYPVMANAGQYGQLNQYAQPPAQFNQFGQVQGPAYGGIGVPGAGVGYGGYQNLQGVYNQPISALNQAPKLPSPRLKKAKDRDLAQSITWKLQTDGKGR